MAAVFGVSGLHSNHSGTMNGIPKFLRRRDRHTAGDGRHHHHSGGSDKEEIPNKSLFTALRAFSSSESCSSDSKKDRDKDEQKKVKSLRKRVSKAGAASVGEVDIIKYALQSTYARGDVEKAFDMLLIANDSIEGTIRGYSPNIKLLGAENRQKTTCYLDALLFAMFARLDCFEPILNNEFSDEPRRKLSVMLRIWVNMLRSGKLITTDITMHLQNALAECGWEDAARSRQQDTSEAFTFITEKLELPLLTLKMDIYHTGKEDAKDDHKFVNERLLEVAIPHEPDDGSTITLEDCLESYFNNKIEVKRHLERCNTLSSGKSFDSISKGAVTQIESVEVGSSAPLSPVISNSPQEDKAPLSSLTEYCDSPVSASDSQSNRRSSIIQQRFIPDTGDDGKDESNARASRSQARRGAYRKEVMMPAWQFFSLIPWYTGNIQNPQADDAQIAAHFSTKRPIVGLCLKRYSISKTGKATRLNTRVDIPTEIGLPHFIQDDSMDEDGPIYGNFKMSLQAFVCHRGKSVDSGHYIAFVRGTSAGAIPTSSSSSFKSSDDPSHNWMRFDDLAQERVTLVDVEKALQTETPYLLFYQILPIDEDASKANLKHKRDSSLSSISNMVRGVGAAGASRLSHNLSGSDHTASTRPSFEVTGPENFEPTPSGNNDNGGSLCYETAGSSNSDDMNAPRLTISNSVLKPEESRNSLSVSVHELGGPKKGHLRRDGSQASENRLSTAFQRFTGLLGNKDKSSDEWSNEDGGDEGAEGTGEVRLEPVKDEKEHRGTGRKWSRDRGKHRERKERSRENKGDKPERECIVM